jgi:hypothetical protein
MEKRLEKNMLTSSNYNIFTETIKNQICYTESIIGMLFFLYYTNTYSKFYVSGNICDIFQNTDYYTLNNIEDNISFKVMSSIYKENGFPDNRNIFQYNYFFNKLYGINNYNNLYFNEYNSLTHNVAFDKNIVQIFKNTIYDNNTIIYNNYSNVSSNRKLILNRQILLDDTKMKKFDNTYYFINLPTYRLNDNYDIKIYDIIIDHIINHTPYKNLILLSGDNAYKKYFYEKYGIITTEYYNQLNINNNCVKALNGLSKSKGNLDGLITDYLYIQESLANHIDFFALIRKLKPELQKKLPQSKFVDWIFKENQIQGIDTVAILLKTKKLIEYAKN